MGELTYMLFLNSFGVEVHDEEVYLSGEHRECAWLDYETARGRLYWDNNKTALWELYSRLSAMQT